MCNTVGLGSAKAPLNIVPCSEVLARHAEYEDALEVMSPSEAGVVYQRFRLAALECGQRRLGDEIAYTVRTARREFRLPWSAIGALLGMTKQAAQQKFGARRQERLTQWQGGAVEEALPMVADE